MLVTDELPSFIFFISVILIFYFDFIRAHIILVDITNDETELTLIIIVGATARRN